MDSKLGDIVKYTDIIPATRNYWLVRSMGGDYYRDFRLGDFIGIGYDKIFLKDLKYAESSATDSHRILKEIIEERYYSTQQDEEVNSSYAASQLLKFATEIKVDDVVIVPGKSDDKLVSIGIVKSNMYEVSASEDECPFTKRIKMKWLLNTDRTALNPSLQLVFNSRHIVSNINHYSEFIDSESSDFYRKDDNTYLVIKINQEDDISTNDFLFLADLIELVKTYADENNFNIKPDDIKIKVYMQSPGALILFSSVFEWISLIGIFLIAVSGGSLKINKDGVDISTKGLLSSISEFLDRKELRKRQEVMTKKIDTMKIENPSALIDAINDTQSEKESE